MILAIDYDLTIVDINGELREGAKENINKLKTDGHYIIIWTSREGESQDEARQFLTTNEIEFDTINENKPGIPNNPKKIIADYYIDDKQINGLPEWNEIYVIISKNKRSTMTTKTNQQHRCIDGKAAVKRSDDGKTFIEWYPSVFNQRSKLIREYGETFFEIIAPGAFARALENPELNCLATVDHAREKMIGRNKSGTLQLSVDDIGLKATVEVPDTTLGRDMVVMIERGDYFEGSFIYTIADKGVTYDRSQKIAVRTVTEAADLYDVSIVIDGAFANTAIKLRSSELITEDDTTIEATAAERAAVEASVSKAEIELDILLKELEILNLKK